MTPDEVVQRYSETSVGLSLRLLPDDEDGPSGLVLIEGRPEALRMLAELLLAVADDIGGDGFFMGPHNAGSFHFSESAELGVYLHRLP